MIFKNLEKKNCVNFISFYFCEGLLHVGDVIKEVNGIPVGTPEQLMDIIRSTDQGITLKIVQNFTEHQPQAQV